MPSEVITDKSLQRELADSIIRMVPLDEIRILLACGAKVNEPVTQGLRPIHYAIWQRYLEAARLLLVRGCDINAVDDCGYSALHLSAEHGYTELVKLLLESGAAVDYRPDTGEEFPRTTLCDEPLRLAIRNKHYAVARLLLEHGADPNKRYFFGAEINLVSDPEYLELLLMFGANPDSRDRAGLTPLMKAARQRKGIESVLLLISYGADVNAMADARNDYRTVMHYAVLGGNTDVVNLLVKQGARVNYDCPDLNKPSALDLAILKGDVPMLQLLLSAGAQVNSSSSVIGTPLHVACSDNISNRKEMVKILLESGADPNLKVYNEDDGAQLRPALAEYLASDTDPCAETVALLLRYGARVIMKTQFRDPDGILNHLQNVTTVEHEHIFYMLLEAAEAFDLCMIKRNNVLNAVQKETLIQRAKTPIALLAQARIFLRKFFGATLINVVKKLEIPKTLHSYLLFECR
ncbi:ankyrin repeat and SOCS box protein 3-like [Maniola hyperantus]|uniref:ankyrin repeat and SOCS box protein 3-like n=1 Tax=Aphantopus hyperantus TaxID=2795564 RepID=UPI001568ABBD|nr:serine/threonine-protein phosphatase 6 regulatory ankyrin repeat subunit C-like [Maniola hyperantus]XP_034827965.1 serine/threonine-protein phosphatase 6 regulatory ankyrin repeat subunit C-like [Maniola hyperantus]